MFFVILSSKCGVVLFVVLCDIWFRVLSWCSFISYWKIYISQLKIQQMIWASTLQIRKHEYFGDLGFIILFVGILPMYAINLGVVSLLADFPFTFLAMFVSNVFYQFDWMNIFFFFCPKRVFSLNLFTSWEPLRLSTDPSQIMEKWRKKRHVVWQNPKTWRFKEIIIFWNGYSSQLN